MYLLARRFGVVAITLALAGCTTTPAEFNNKPAAVSKAALCKTALETQDPAFQFQLVSEVNRRGMSMLECEQMVAQQRQAAAVLVGLALVGTAAAVCANGNCGGGGYTPYRRYPGNCYSYYDRAADGSLCGNRSAMSRPGGWQ
ncbi:hypothetical protein [Rhizobium ruizarguesonis]|uniref:Lipoprotein n=1 Tax=Rhizobium ruizarguesonis TaxID=2081791 RepID=A0AAE8QI32_9HYPH|nr:hypothetical protein [Rhizobium ruizarguesonis]TBA19357.1 hypothetical protein ELH65_10280 [Rhizobium ruizarguesonis]TBE52736.1 hypothetical protein ELH06_09100 [Rhizobium ruizarguesonis]TBF21746.1 hypothetical protein ELG94_08785 [Rhizobium ruizarguesonis]